MPEELRVTIGPKQREAINALERKKIADPYLIKLKNDFDEIVKKLIPKAENEKTTPNQDYAPLKIILECRKTIQELIKRFEFAGKPRLKLIIKIAGKQELTKADGLETSIKGEADEIVEKLVKSISSVLESIQQDSRSNKQTVIETAKKAGEAVEDLKIVDAMQTIREKRSQDCAAESWKKWERQLIKIAKLAEKKKKSGEVTEVGEDDQEALIAWFGDREDNPENPLGKSRDNDSFRDDLDEFGNVDDAKDEIPPELLENRD